MVIGSADTLFSAEEVYEPFNFYSQGVYIHLNRQEKCVETFVGDDSPSKIILGALKLSKKLAKLENFIHNPNVKNFSNTNREVFKPMNWVQAPRLMRIYEAEGEELTSPRAFLGVNFSFKQSDLR